MHDEVPAPDDGARGERFGAIPRRLLDALERGDIGHDEWAVACYLVCAADFETHELAKTLRGLGDAIGWEKSEDTLSRVLQRLRASGWIEYETRPGQRRPYVIRLAGLLRGADLRTTSAPETPFMRRSLPQSEGQEPQESPQPSGILPSTTSAAPISIEEKRLDERVSLVQTSLVGTSATEVAGDDRKPIVSGAEFAERVDRDVAINRLSAARVAAGLQAVDEDEAQLLRDYTVEQIDGFTASVPKARAA